MKLTMDSSFSVLFRWKVTSPSLLRQQQNEQFNVKKIRKWRHFNLPSFPYMGSMETRLVITWISYAIWIVENRIKITWCNKKEVFWIEEKISQGLERRSYEQETSKVEKNFFCFELFVHQEFEHFISIMIINTFKVSKCAGKYLKY